jgi:hypothetical protein
MIAKAAQKSALTNIKMAQLHWALNVEICTHHSCITPKANRNIRPKMVLQQFNQEP